MILIGYYSKRNLNKFGVFMMYGFLLIIYYRGELFMLSFVNCNICINFCKKEDRELVFFRLYFDYLW